MKGKNGGVDLDIPISSWSEDDVLDGKKVRAFTIILRTAGCSWFRKMGCTMCGYSNDCPDTPVSDENLLKQMENALERYDGESYIKIFTSGSYLDEEEISRVAADGMIGMIHERIPDCRILIESRPEFITEERMASLRELHSDIEIAIGVLFGELH